MNALTQLGMVSDSPSENQTMPEATHAAAAETTAKETTATEITAMETTQAEPGKDYFVQRDGECFAGMHLLIDLWGATNLDDPTLIDNTLCAGALAAGATILHSHFHHFTPNAGVSGVVVLAESHISIHTWPERGFAALDIFMCGTCDPHAVTPYLQTAFKPSSIQVDEQKRGLVR